MLWQAKRVQLVALRAAAEVIAKIAFITALLVFGFMGSTAVACPESEQAIPPLAASGQIERILPVAAAVISAAPAQKVGTLNRQNGGPCCGSGCHMHGIACATGCCFASFASISPANSGLFLPARSVRLLPTDQAESISARPPPDFRPPRNFS